MIRVTPPRPWGAIGRLLSIGARPGDDRDLTVRKRTAVAVLLALVGSGVVYAILGLQADRPALWVFAGFQIVVQLGALALFHRTGQLVPVVLIMISIGLLTIASGIAALGGLEESSGNLVFGVLAPLGAVMLLGRRAALPAFAAYAAVVLWAAITDPVWRAQVSPIPDSLGIPLYVTNLLLSGALALALVVFIDGERVRAKGQAESLLLNVLPRSIVERLHGGERVIADHYPDVTVLFSDVVDFTPLSERESPERVVVVLNELFTAFDALAGERSLEKIKTIGDAYMVVAGVPEEREDHVEVMLDMAIAMHAAASVQPEVDGRRLELRTGIASGPVVAGVIGRQKFSYDLWGDTVNTASRMESSGVPGCIQVTEATWRHCRSTYPWQVREGVEVKGKGPMRTYLLDAAAALRRDRPRDPIKPTSPSSRMRVDP